MKILRISRDEKDDFQKPQECLKELRKQDKWDNENFSICGSLEKKLKQGSWRITT